MIKIKKSSIIPLIFAVSFNMAVYCGSRIIAGDWYHYNIESSLDRMIPLWAPSVIIYLGCYLFWGVNYVLIAQQDRETVCRFFSADFLSRVVCLIFFLIFPTTNVRPVLDTSGFWNQILNYVYSVDAADNLFPSIHCLVSWFCYIGIRGKNNIPVWYRGLSCIMALLVCVSTLLTKQHVIIDVIGGVLLAEFCLLFTKKTTVWKIYGTILDKINTKIFPGERE